VKHYGQYCPIARTSELVAERWTPIIIRNLLNGCRTFGELQAGAPGISKALLAERLQALERHGIVAIAKEAVGRGRSYQLTPKGLELKAVTDAMGAWGARWLELQPHDVDAAYVLWATCKLVAVDRLPPDGLVVRVELTDRPREQWWLLARRPQAEVCSTSPGRTEDLVMRTDSETLARWHLRHVTFDEAERLGRIALDGPRRLAASFVASIQPSPFAAVGLRGRMAGPSASCRS
jgi:DNA-binding HxlR family transcriptional regulator